MPPTPEPTASPATPRPIERREFLQQIGAGALVLAVFGPAGCRRPEESLSGDSAAAAATGSAAALTPAAYVRVDTNGAVTVICHRSEMGQGVRSSVAMAVADELEADWSKVHAKMADADERFGRQGTGGSTSTRGDHDPMRKAAAAIEAVKRAGFVVERKSDESPVTEADRIAEALIVEGLRAAVPDIPVVAEEEAEAGIAPAAFKARRFWLVDPLDGTKGFARGGDEYAVCIGLVEDGRALLGAIALPSTGELFGGIVGADARRVLPLTAWFGAVLLVLADTAARTLVVPAELPVGILTALLGAPVLFLLLQRAQREMGAGG